MSGSQEIPESLRGERQWETEENVELYKAAASGDYERLKIALAKGANANYWNKRGDQLGALHAAARSNSENGSALCAKELISSGARVSAALISNLNAPIHEAANVGSEEVCRVLLEASPSATSAINVYGNSALHAAARSGSANVVTILLDHGADINTQNHRGSTALHIACFLASAESGGDGGVDPYLKIGAILLCNDDCSLDLPDTNGYTPLHIAAQKGCGEMVKLLIDSGASLTAKTLLDSKGRGARTPLGMALFGGNDATAKLLDEAMAKDAGEIVTKKMARKKLLED